MTTGTRKPPPPRESEIQRSCLAWLKAHGYFAYRRNVMAMAGEYNGKRRFVRAGERGMSDITGLIPRNRLPLGAQWARPFDVEIKRPGKRPTLEQVHWLRHTNTLTGAAFWVTDLTMLERVMACLSAGGRVEYAAETKRYGKTCGPSDAYGIVWPD